VYERTLVRQPAVRPDEDVVGDRLTEDLDLEHVGDDLLGLAVNVGMYERDKVVAGNDVAERGEALLDPLNRDGFRERVAEVLEFLVGRCRGDEETVAVTCRRRLSVIARRDGKREEKGDGPATNRPMMRVPPILVWMTGMTSPSSASKVE